MSFCYGQDIMTAGQMKWQAMPKQYSPLKFSTPKSLLSIKHHIIHPKLYNIKRLHVLLTTFCISKVFQTLSFQLNFLRFHFLLFSSINYDFCNTLSLRLSPFNPKQNLLTEVFVKALHSSDNLDNCCCIISSLPSKLFRSLGIQ